MESVRGGQPPAADLLLLARLHCGVHSLFDAADHRMSAIEGGHGQVADGIDDFLHGGGLANTAAIAPPAGSDPINRLRSLINRRPSSQLSMPATQAAGN